MAIECYDDKCGCHRARLHPPEEFDGPFCDQEVCIKTNLSYSLAEKIRGVFENMGFSEVRDCAATTYAWLEKQLAERRTLMRVINFRLEPIPRSTNYEILFGNFYTMMLYLGVEIEDMDAETYMDENGTEFSLGLDGRPCIKPAKPMKKILFEISIDRKGLIEKKDPETQEAWDEFTLHNPGTTLTRGTFDLIYKSGALSIKKKCSPDGSLTPRDLFASTTGEGTSGRDS